MKQNRFGYWSLLFLAILVVNCTRKEHHVPKPPTYLELMFPERIYSDYVDDCGYTFRKPSYFVIHKAQNLECNRDIDFEMLNGTLYLSRIDMDTTLSAYINHALDKVEEHKVKAFAIYDSTFIRSDSRVFGTFFELQGNVASPFQFYLTDSTKNFISGVVYFDSRPNYDSIKPVLDFVKKDLFEMIETLEWE